MIQRFFSPDSFWNQPLPRNPDLDPESDAIIARMDERWGPIYLNCQEFAVPVYEVDARTPRVRVAQRGPRPGVTGMMLEREKRYRQHPDFAASQVPIPEHALPDPADDAHIAVIDRENGRAWDMWRARKREDGSWESSTGMVYDLNGSGIWATEDFPIKDGESIHFYGPSRAAGVPVIAGLILEAELRAGRIEHKLSMASSPRVQHFAWPAAWADGGTMDGPIEGTVMQLDPQLDLDAFPLTPAARCIARAMQEYGAVMVDGAGGNVIYTEQLGVHPGRSWAGVLDPDDLRCIPLTHYRWLKPDRIIKAGDDFWPKWQAAQRA